MGYKVVGLLVIRSASFIIIVHKFTMLKQVRPENLKPINLKPAT